MNFEDEVINFFKDTYNIDLKEKNDVLLDNMLFPNYITQQILNIDQKGYTSFEYCRIINKIFGFNYVDSKLSYYENNKVKINSDDIIFDCGANSGIFSLYGAYKGKKVYAFEPMTLIRHYLKNTQRYNDKIIIVPCGIGDKVKKAYFNQADNPGASRENQFQMPAYHQILYKELVNIISIDAFVEKTGIIPTFIKMDIENGEVLALKGAIETLRKYNPKCSISIHEENIDNIKYIKSLFPTNYNFYLNKEKNYDIVLLGESYG